jgi:phosphoglycerate dehydrogenase-like enzyme
MGLAGYGGVGREVARRALAFDMSVIAVKRTPPATAPPDGVQVWGADGFYRMLEHSDVVVVSAPGTAETYRMFDEAAFRHMRPGAMLVNVGRGTTVDLDALTQALQDGRIAGAGLDVTDPEPLPEGHPLWRMDNVVITPHIAGAAPERAGRNEELVMENLRRFVHGEPLLSVVDPNAGY